MIADPRDVATLLLAYRQLTNSSGTFAENAASVKMVVSTLLPATVDDHFDTFAEFVDTAMQMGLASFPLLIESCASLDEKVVIWQRMLRVAMRRPCECKQLAAFDTMRAERFFVHLLLLGDVRSYDAAKYCLFSMYDKLDTSLPSWYVACLVAFFGHATSDDDDVQLQLTSIEYKHTLTFAGLTVLEWYACWGNADVCFSIERETHVPLSKRARRFLQARRFCDDGELCTNVRNAARQFLLSLQ